MGVVAWGTELSNSSARSNVEKVRFASSAVPARQYDSVIDCRGGRGYHTLLEVKFAVGGTLLLFGGSGGGPVLVQQAEAGLEVLA